MLAGPVTWTSLGTVVAVLGLLSLPLFLRFHHLLLILGWNAVVTCFFLPGAPRVWMPLVAISLAISILHRAVDRRFRFVSVPEVTLPLLALVAIVLITAKLTGGIGLKTFGSDVYGGKRYIFLLVAIAGYFALTAQPIPPKRAKLYVALFLLGGITSIVGDLLYVDSSSLQYLYLLFPPTGYLENASAGMLRFAGVSAATTLLFGFMLAKYGIRGIFTFKRPWRLFFFVIFVLASLLGGFRSNLIAMALVFTIQFFLEKLHQTKLLPIFVAGIVLVSAISLPFVRQMPFSVQRTLSILPIDVDPVAKMDAEYSTEWRLNIWKAVLPQVPHYFWLGKGLAMTERDYAFAAANLAGETTAFSDDQSWAALSADYHNGPLSVIIPFGIWGAIAFLWFLISGFRVVLKNYRYGNSDLKIANTYLLAAYVGQVIGFMVIYGSLYSDMRLFVGWVGLSVAINNGVAKPVVEPVVQTVAEKRSRRLIARPAFARAN